MEQGNHSRPEFEVAGGIEALGLKGVFFAASVDQGKADTENIAALLRQTSQNIRANPVDVKDDEILEGYRKLHAAVGVSNRKHVSSPENLIGLIQGGRSLPSINPVVDIYNVVSLETRLALGAHDTSKLGGVIALRRTDGSEQFTPLGSTEKKQIGGGEYAYIDEDNNEVICRLETRQCEKTKVTDTTQECFFIVEGNANTTIEYLEEAMERLRALLSKYCGDVDIRQIRWLGK